MSTGGVTCGGQCRRGGVKTQRVVLPSSMSGLADIVQQPSCTR